MRARRSVASLAALVVLVAACGQGDEGRDDGAPTSVPITSSTSVAIASTGEPAPAERAAVVATATSDRVEVYARADDGEPTRTITAAEVTSAPGIPITFLVLSEGSGRVEVLLPVRPNGSTGWVERSAVALSAVRHRIEVSLSEYRLRVYEIDELVLDEPVGVGRQDRPTPGGAYFVKELLEPPDPGGIYGPYAYGLSGFSNAISSFAGGDAVIGIHGTDRPDLLGQDVSSGCIRVHNDVVRRLVEEVGIPLGTPVEILP